MNVRNTALVIRKGGLKYYDGGIRDMTLFLNQRLYITSHRSKSNHPTIFGYNTPFHVRKVKAYIYDRDGESKWKGEKCNVTKMGREIIYEHNFPCRRAD